MDLVERCSFNRWAYYIQALGFKIIGYQIEPFLLMIPIEEEEHEE